MAIGCHCRRARAEQRAAILDGMDWFKAAQIARIRAGLTPVIEPDAYPAGVGPLERFDPEHYDLEIRSATTISSGVDIPQRRQG